MLCALRDGARSQAREQSHASITNITKDKFDPLFVECGILVHGCPRLCIAGLGEQQRAAHEWGLAFVDA